MRRAANISCGRPEALGSNRFRERRRRYRSPADTVFPPLSGRGAGLTGREGLIYCLNRSCDFCDSDTGGGLAGRDSRHGEVGDPKRVKQSGWRGIRQRRAFGSEERTRWPFRKPMDGGFKDGIADAPKFSVLSGKWDGWLARRVTMENVRFPAGSTVRARCA